MLREQPAAGDEKYADLVDGDHIAEAHAQVLAHNLIDPDLGLLHCLVSQDNADRVLALLALQVSRGMRD